MKTAIIGGGISGLSAAFYLRKLSIEKGFPLELTLFEKSNSLGGVFDTLKYKDLILEQGPDSFITTKPWALELVNELGLQDFLIKTNEINRRTFVFIDGKLKPLPEGFLMIAPTRILPFLKSDLFSWKAKIRILMEFFVPSGFADDENLQSFVIRRFGKEAFEKAAQPLISGIYTADPRELSLRATMPQFLDMEKTHRSIISALLKKDYGAGNNQSGARYSMFLSLKDGMQSLIKKLEVESDIDNLCLNTEVAEINKKGSWIISTEDKREEFDSVIISAPAFSASSLLKRLDPSLSSILREIEYASSVVVNLVFDKENFKNKPDGFGVVVPSTENMNLIACSFYTEKFPARNNTDLMVVRCFLGGKLNPEVLDWDDEKILSTLKSEMETIFGLSSEPKEIFIKRYRQSMPQFKVGHTKKIEDIMTKVLNYKGLALCGNVYCGVGIPDCIRSGIQAANKLFNDLL